MDPIELFCSLIMLQEGWGQGSRSWRNRNPGNLRASAYPHQMDAGGYCVFANLAEGWYSLKHDVTLKFLGHSTTGLTQASSLQQFFDRWAPREDGNDPVAYCSVVCEGLTRGLGRKFAPDSKLRDVWAPAEASGGSAGAQGQGGDSANSAAGDVGSSATGAGGGN